MRCRLLAAVAALALASPGFAQQLSGQNPSPALAAPDIGAATGTSLILSGNSTAGASGSFLFNGRGGLTGAADGIFSFKDTAGTSFGRLQFGGTTSSFPSIKRNGAAFDFRLADDSAYASLTVNALTVNGATTGSPSGFACLSVSNLILYQILPCNAALAASTTIGSDVILFRKAAASFQFGATDGAAPVAQTLGVQSVVAGTSNTAGQNWIIRGSIGTGTGVGGDIILKVAPAGTTGTSQNALVTALTISNKGVPVIPSYTVATLPSSPPDGSIAMITDGNAACTYGATPTGSGSTKCRVIYLGGWVE